MLFKYYIFSLLSPYLRNSDSYKDGNGEGLIERYLWVLGKYWDDNLKPLINNALELYNVGYFNNRFISYISYLIGCMPQGTLNDSTYKLIVKNWISINKVKGTKLCYYYLLSLYDSDLVVEVIEHYPVKVRRDEDPTRDDETSFRDMGCPNCTKYDINLSYLSEPTSLEAFEADIRFLISAIEPINCSLDLLTFSLIPSPYHLSDIIATSGKTESLTIMVSGEELITLSGDFTLPPDVTLPDTLLVDGIIPDEIILTSPEEV